jgi:crotonobetainyl-CoA:carnitine CoA-transferase CaiB-like acyl-CoA transferase
MIFMIARLSGDPILMPAVARLAAGPMLEDGQRRRRIPLGPGLTMRDVLDAPHWRARSSLRAHNADTPAAEIAALERHGIMGTKAI